MAKAIIRKVNEYNEDLIKSVFLENKNFILNGLKPQDKVLVKPNFLSYNPPERAVTTHPIFIKAFVKFLLENNLNVIIGDIPGRSMSGAKLKELSGVLDLEGENLKIEDLGIYGFRVAGKSVNGLEIKLSQVLWEVKRVFNLPKMKTHSLTFISGATKNLFGLIPRKDRLTIHSISDPILFSKVLIDINKFLPVPQIILMDGILGMEGDGPSFGNPVTYNCLIISDDPLIADLIMSKIMDFEINDVPLFKNEIPLNYELDGNINEFIKKSEKPKTFLLTLKGTSKIASLIYRYLGDYIQPKPYVNKNKCVKCGVCASVCAGKAITLNPYPNFNREKCVLCYCCHELCPEGAIYLKRGIISKILKT
ncbi:MAG: DUF362 domain-containing protein [Caldisericia bacterium]|jgi:uncharacterized protein (DUF362 family)/Pyruvate/2-oxoacid:ferredoxin oxidoreductase delta subunit|nr:DUF362 domain-containing protein [Caldisericia bacterium]